MPRIGHTPALLVAPLMASLGLGFAFAHPGAPSGAGGQSQVDPSKPRRAFTQARHYTPGSRNKGTIKRVVLHTVEGPFLAAKNWFLDPNSKVSAHYVVDFNGSVLQMVLDKDKAWHVRGHNADTIGIEHAGYARRNGWTQAQIQASARVVGEICSDYEIEPSQSTIVSHAALDPSRRSDPGRYLPWGQYLQLVKQTKQQADQAKKNGTTLPRFDASGFSGAEGSGNASGTQFADGSINTGSTGSIGIPGSGTASHGSAGYDSGADRMGQLAADVLGQALEGVLGDKGSGSTSQTGAQSAPGTQTHSNTATPGYSPPSTAGPITARGNNSTDGGYGSLVSSSRGGEPNSSSPTSSSRSDSTTGNDAKAAPDRNRGRSRGRDLSNSGEPARTPDKSKDEPADGDGSSYGGTRPGTGYAGSRPRSRGKGNPGDARRERAHHERARDRDPSSCRTRRRPSQRQLNRQLTQALETLKQLGYKNTVGAGILANLLEESDLNTGILEGDSRNVIAAGIGYWVEDGLDDLWAAAERKGADWQDLRFQIRHLDRELKADFGSMRRRLRRATSPETSARIFASGVFELDRQNHDDELDRRAVLARQIFEGTLEPGAGSSRESRQTRGAKQAAPTTQDWDDF